MSWEAYVHLAFDEIRLAGAGSPQVARRLKAALTDLRSIVPPERVGIIDLQLDLLLTTTEAALSDERDVELALHEDREGIGAAASSIDGTALLSPPRRQARPRGQRKETASTRRRAPEVRRVELSSQLQEGVGQATSGSSDPERR